MAYLGLLGTYLLLGAITMKAVESRWAREIQSTLPVASARAVVVPAFPGPFRWLRVAETPDAIVRSRFWAWQANASPRAAFAKAPTGSDVPDVEAHPAVKAFRRRGPFVHRRAKKVGDAWLIEYEDLAFEDHPFGGPMVLRLRVEPTGAVRRIEFGHRL